MATTGIARKRLILKELRQLLPLAASAILILIFLLAIVTLTNRTGLDRTEAFVAILVGMPGLFAVGIGAILVGQEKEQRTILWLQSLPLAKRDLVVSKLIASLIGLVILWIVSFVLVTVFAGSEIWNAGSQLTSDRWSGVTLPLHTLYLLLAGFALSWRIQSAFMALVALVPVAFAPLVLAWLLIPWMNIYQDQVLGSPVLVASQIVCCIIAAMLGWHFAMINLSPASSARAKLLTKSTTISFGAPYSRFSALLWQFARQNKTILWSIAGLYSIAALILLVGFSNRTSAPRDGELPLFLTVLFATFATSWLGVTVFQSDRVHRRIRFLSDRGYSPSLTWFSRQAIPICIGVTATIVILAAGGRAAFDHGPSHRAIGYEIVTVLVLPVVLAFCTAYSISQWLGQLLDSPILAAVAAPAASIAVFAFQLFCFENVGASLLLLLAVLVIPLLTTRVLMRRWMDDRRDLFYWLTHATSVVMIFVLPVTMLIVTWLTSPTMSRATQLALAEQATKPSSVEGNLELVLILPTEKNRRVNDDESSNEDMVGPAGSISDESPETSDDNVQRARPVTPPSLESLSIAQRSNYIIAKLNEQLDSTGNRPVRLTIRTVQWIRGELMTTRWQALAKANKAANTSPIESSLSRAGTEASAADSLDNPVTAQSSVAPDTAPGNEAVALESSPRLESAAKRYNDLLRLSTRIVQRARNSPLISDHAMLDRLEIALVAELQQVQGKQLVEPKVWAELLHQIGDTAQRNEDRRSAIASAWKAYQKSGFRSGELIDLVEGYRGKTDWTRVITTRSRISHVIELLWQFSDPTQANSQQLREQLADGLQVARSLYGIGNGGEFLRADNLDKFIFESGETIRSAVGTQWHAGWERQAEQLAKGQP